MKLAAFGRTQWLSDSIRLVASRGHQVVLLGTAPAAPEYTVTEADFLELADELDCPSFCDANINHPEYLRLAKASGAAVAISVNWPTLIGPEMLAHFAHGVINAHAGDLPRFRGNAAPNWAILAGEPHVVLTLHQMADMLDHGPILAQRVMPLDETTYIAEVYGFLSEHIPALFAEVVDGLAAGTLKPRMPDLDPAKSLRCLPRLPRDGAIEWTRPAIELARVVRASAEPFAGAYSFLGTEKVIVWRAHAEPLLSAVLGVPGQVTEIRRRRGEVAILTGQGVLVLEEIEMRSAGRRRATELITSTRSRLGLDIPAALQELQERIAKVEAQLRLEPLQERR